LACDRGDRINLTPPDGDGDELLPRPGILAKTMNICCCEPLIEAAMDGLAAALA